MEMRGVIAVAAILAIPVIVIMLMISVSGLKRRLASLERDLAEQGRAIRALRNAATMPETPAKEPVVAASEPEPAATEPARPAADPAMTGPWAAPEPYRADPKQAPRKVRPGPGPLARAASWFQANWVYAVSALSLALAGVFFVQYGVENGLLPPLTRVIAAIFFGAALIAGGEWIRRRHGDGAASSTAYLPSVFAGAGLVSIFAGVLAARQLYGLIGSETAFVGFLATAALAIGLGWFHGPFLAAFGLIGAALAPFLVGGESDAPYWLYAYYAVIASVGLMIDTIRRWAWLSVLALVLAYGGGALILVGTGGAGWAAIMLAVLPLLAIAVPARGLFPDHGGAMMAEALKSRASPIFPTLLAGAAVAASTAGLVLLPVETAAESALAYLCLAVLALALIVWSGKAPALSDLTLLPAAGFLLRLGFEGADRGPLLRDYAAAAITLRVPETGAPMTSALLLGLATLITLGAAWASGGAGRLKPFWAAGAALVAPLVALVMELFWAPSLVLGAYHWALHVIALAALMAAMAVRFARADAGDRRRTAYATLSALSLIALALFLVMTKGALTLALAVLVVVATLLDRRFRLPEMGLFIQAAVIGLGWRLVVDPGLGWAIEDAALWEVIASYGGAAAAMLTALRLMRGMDRRGAKVFAESGGAGFAALLVNVLLTRWLIRDPGGDWVVTHWAISLNAMPWLILMLIQLYRVQLGGRLRFVRWAIAALAALLGFGGLLAAAGPANPLAGFLHGQPEGLVYGPLVFDTLFVAYALPGLLLLAAVTRLGHLHPVFRALLGVVGAALLALYAGLEIRRFWRGDDLSVPGITQPELYSYTIAMMALGAALLYQAIARRSPGLRRMAMGVIALTVAKVFLIDVSGLTGLTRVFSFLALGLSLATLAWLNRWAAGRQGGGETPAAEGTPVDGGDGEDG